MNILVIIVTYNARKWADQCFNSLRNSTIVPDVFVIDNGSTDGTQIFIQENYPEVIFQQSKDNLGFGKANNIGLQYALDNGYDFVYLLNQDAWILPETIERLIAISLDNPEYGILSPFQMEADMIKIDAKFLKNTCSWSSNSSLLNDLYNNHLNDVYSVSTVMAAHWFMPISVIREVGGFSPSFPHYGEDYNYIERVKYHLKKVGIVPTLRVVHDRGDREDTKERKIYLGYIFSIEMVSSPKIPFGRAMIYALENSIRLALKFKTVKPIGNFIKVMLDFHCLKRNKVISLRDERAFLE